MYLVDIYARLFAVCHLSLVSFDRSRVMSLLLVADPPSDTLKWLKAKKTDNQQKGPKERKKVGLFLSISVFLSVFLYLLTFSLSFSSLSLPLTPSLYLTHSFINSRSLSLFLFLYILLTFSLSLTFSFYLTHIIFPLLRSFYLSLSTVSICAWSQLW
jgi:hypothetical protein